MKQDLEMAALFLVLMLATAAAQSDVECLREFKSSVQTTGEYLQSWDFGSSSSSKPNSSQQQQQQPPNICNFIGVQCLHPSEIKVYSLSLPGAGLRGSFPKGLEKCGSLTGLDLSSNALTGPIPNSICQMLPYLVKLDLAQNNITGSIPEGLSSCLYLNQIRLQRNQLEGSIPGQIGLLPRLREFDVADNRLAGAIPYTFAGAASHGAGFPAAAFEGNDGLCGPPLKRECRPDRGGGGGKGDGRGRRSGGAAMVAGVAVGGTVALLAAASICVWVMIDRMKGRESSQAKGGSDLLDNSWLQRLNPGAIIVSMFEQPLVKIKLSDLAAATGGFSRDAVISMGRGGVCYKATLRDGSVLTIKRLRPGGSEKQFRAEMESLAKVRHRNLVPLLGFCAAGGERMLVYKFMGGGSLAERLHSNSGGDGDVGENGELEQQLDWPSRLRIAVGAARGLAWMHHSCNPRLVHRGVSSHAILLDEDMEARITDFGLARLLGGGGGGGDGDYYAPPEEQSYTSSTAVTAASAKGDVYGFGVVLLELVTGRRPSEGGNPASEATPGRSTGGRRSLVEWIGELFKSGHVSEAIDPRLVAAEAAAMAAAAAAADSDNSSSGSGRRREVMQVLKIACTCVLSFPKERPSMYEVYHMLRGVGEDYYYCPPGGGGGGGGRSSRRVHLRQQNQLRQVEDEGDIAAAALARSAAEEEEQQQGGVQMQRLESRT